MADLHHSVFVSIFQELFVDSVVFCFLIVDLCYGYCIAIANLSSRTCQENRRVGGDDKLSMACLAHVL